MATERTELGREIETALREVLAHVRGEVNLARRIVDDPKDTFPKPDVGMICHLTDSP